MSKPENKRVKGVAVSVPIVYGTISYPLGKKAEEGEFFELDQPTCASMFAQPKKNSFQLTQ